MAATVMEGIETQQHPFVSVIDQGHFTSDRLEGAGTKVVKRTAEAMNAMIKTYEEKAAELEHPQQKRMKRATDTGGYMGEVTEKVDPIVSTRSPQALAIVKAKLIVDPEGKIGGGEAGKWIVPPHSLVFALRDREQYVISAVADVQNFFNKSSGEAKYAPIGVSLEDGLDATKFHKEHESRRYFSVAVEGVVSLQCHLDDAKKFNFGDPVFVNTTAGTAGCFKLNFYDTTHYRLTNNGTFRIGYFVEQIDRVRGGIRVKLAIQNQAGGRRLNNRSSGIITYTKNSYENAVKNAIDAVYDKTIGSLRVLTETDARNGIETLIDDVKKDAYASGSLEDAVKQYYANIGFPYDGFIAKEETAAKRRANAQLDIELAKASGSTAPPAALAAVASTVVSESEQNQENAVFAMKGFARNFYHLEFFYEESVKVGNRTENQQTLKTLGLGPRNGKNDVLETMVQNYINNRESFFTTDLDDKKNSFEELEAGLALYMDGGCDYKLLKSAIINKLNGDLSFLYNIDDEGNPKLAEAQYKPFVHSDEILYKATPDDVRNAGKMLRELITKLFQAADEGKDVSDIDFEYNAKNDSTVYQEEIDKLDGLLGS